MSKNLEGISKGRRQGEQTTPEEEGTVSFGPTYAMPWGGSTCSLPIMSLKHQKIHLLPKPQPELVSEI